MRFLGAAVLLSLAGCTTPSTDPRVAIVWNRVADPQPVCESLSGRKSFFHILGCSHWSEPVAQGAPRVCTIYSPEPRSERDTQRFATLGHELMHCFDGNWHDRWGRMNVPPVVKEGAPARRAPRDATASSGDRS